MTDLEAKNRPNDDLVVRKTVLPRAQQPELLKDTFEEL